MEERDTQERERQRKMIKERNIKTENTFSTLQEEDTESLGEEKEPPQIVKIDIDDKKICEGKRRGRIKKAHSERKGESEMGPKSVLPKNYSNKGTQNKNLVPLRYKSVECHNECYKYKTKKCLELHDKLHHSQQGKEKVQELKETNYTVVFRKREQTRRRYLWESVQGEE